jgi:WD40 repeat protein
MLAVLFKQSRVLLDAQTGKVLLQSDIQDRQFRDCVFSNDSKRLLIASDTETSIIEVKTFKVERSFCAKGTEYPLGIAWSPDDSLIAIASSDGHLDLWDAKTGTKSHTFVAEGSIPLFVTFLGKDMLLTADDKGNIAQWSIDQKKLFGRQKCSSGEITGMRVSPNGKRLCIASIDRDVVVYDLIQR